MRPDAVIAFPRMPPVRLKAIDLPSDRKTMSSAVRGSCTLLGHPLGSFSKPGISVSSLVTIQHVINAIILIQITVS